MSTSFEIGGHFLAVELIILLGSSEADVVLILPSLADNDPHALPEVVVALSRQHGPDVGDVVDESLNRAITPHHHSLPLAIDGQSHFLAVAQHLLDFRVSEGQQRLSEDLHERVFLLEDHLGVFLGIVLNVVIILLQCVLNEFLDLFVLDRRGVVDVDELELLGDVSEKHGTERLLEAEDVLLEEIEEDPRSGMVY